MKILVALAHVDDELSCGATLNKLASDTERHQINFVAFSDRSTQPDPSNEQEFTTSLSHIMGKSWKDHSRVLEFKTCFFPDHHMAIRDWLERFRKHLDPDIVFTHTTHDLHQDHRTLAEEARSVFRDRTVLAGELGNSENGFEPNFYVKVSREAVQAKIDAAQCYPLEKEKSYMDKDHILGLATYRGTQVRVPLAEAFEVWRIVTEINGDLVK